MGGRNDEAPPASGSKLPTRQPPPGHPALEKDFFVRFDELSGLYDDLVKRYKELKHVSGSHEVRWRMHSLEPWGDNDEDVIDRLPWLWPSVKDIHFPERDYYAKRASLLVGSFPSAAPHSPQVFIKMLVSAILVKAPSCMVLEAACFELTTTYKYSNAPNIADLMTLIDKHAKLWDERLRIHDEIESGRALEFAKRRLAYEEEEEQKKIERTIGKLEELNQPEMIKELRERGIDALDEEFKDKVSKLEHEAWEINNVVRRLTELEERGGWSPRAGILAKKVKKSGFEMVEKIKPQLMVWEEEAREQERDYEKYYSDSKPKHIPPGARIRF